MKLRTKIIFGFAVIASIGWLLGVVGLVSNQLNAGLNKDQTVIRESYVDAANVLAAHYEWRHSLTMAVSNGQAFTGSTDPNTCALGQWLNSDTLDTDDPELSSLFAQVVSPHDFIHRAATDINQMTAAGEDQEALRYLNEKVLPRTDETIALIGQIEHRYQSLLADVSGRITVMQRVTAVLIICLILVAVISGVILVIRIIKSIMLPIRTITACSHELTKGRLDIEFDYPVDDEIGQLGQAFLNMTAHMKEQSDVLASLSGGDYTTSIKVRSELDTVNQAINMLVAKSNAAFSEVRLASNQVSAGSELVSQAAQSLAESTGEQATTVEQLTKRAAEIQAMASENAEEARVSLKYTEEAAQLMTESMSALGELNGAMQEIDENSQQITKVIKVIDDIAFQTNILAINAAVEAARAGEQGKGFAVVAHEVRNLASKSAEAAKETAGMIEGSSTSVAEGRQIVIQVNDRMRDMEALTQKTSELVKMVYDASIRQDDSLTGLAAGIEHISAMIQANSATAEESAASSEELSAQAKQLDEIVDQFRLQPVQ